MIVMLDVIMNDVAGIYDNQTATQLSDAKAVFKLLLTYIRIERANIVVIKPVDQLKEYTRQAINETKDIPISLWHETFHFKRSHQRDIPFSRGGGFYHFLDMKKGLFPGSLDDSSRTFGLYVTPENRANRDNYYAFSPSRCRMYLDIPSILKGGIKPQNLKSTNRNCYEAIIQHKDLDKIKNPRIDATVRTDKYLSSHGIGREFDFDLFQSKYDFNADAAFKKRIRMIGEICRSKDRDLVRKECLTQEELNPKLKQYILQLKALCERHQKHLVQFPDPTKQEMVNSLEAIIQIDDTKPLIREIRAFAQKLAQVKAQLIHLDDHLNKFIHDIKTLSLNILSFNHLESTTPLVFFHNPGETFVRDAMKMTDEANLVFNQHP